MSSIRPRIEFLLQCLQRGIYEKETELSLSLLAALAGESVLLLGPPGVAKSMVARRLKTVFRDARSFEYLMSRFSTPDELFGPVSIARLKEADKYERATDGFLPTADVVFLDEIWKAGPAIQNSLLTVLNEKLFRNGERELHLPLKLLVAASNELPAKDEGLEALWDRFLVRIVCRNIEDERTFRKMLTEDTDYETETAEDNVDKMAIGKEEYADWQRSATRLPLSAELLDAIGRVRRRLQRVEIENTDIPRRIYISDRRWKHIAGLLRTAAFVQDRSEAAVSDLWPAIHCLWNEPEERGEVRRIVLEAIFAPLTERLEQLHRCVKTDLRTLAAREALSHAKRENDHRDDDLIIADRYFYQIENHGTGHSHVFITDFKRMPIHGRDRQPAQGVMYSDPVRHERLIVRLATSRDGRPVAVEGGERVTLCRDDTHIYINGVPFRMRREGRAALSPADGRFGNVYAPFASSHLSDATAATPDRYADEAERICTDLERMERALNDNLFVQATERKEIAASVQQAYRRVALCRADIGKLYDDAAE